ncbi:MAG: hypothetical protein AAB966_04750 [Patescibacteria group bacterium]
MDENSIVCLYDPYVWSEVVITMPPEIIVKKIAEMAGKTFRLGEAIEEIGLLIDGVITFVPDCSAVYLHMDIDGEHFDWRLLRVREVKVE